MKDVLIALTAAVSEFRRVLKRRTWMRRHHETIDLPF